jgi:hypothetical protein
MALGPGASLIRGVGWGVIFRPSAKCELKLLSAVLEANQSLRVLKKVTLVGPRFRREHEGCSRPIRRQRPSADPAAPGRGAEPARDRQRPERARRADGAWRQMGANPDRRHPQASGIGLRGAGKAAEDPCPYRAAMRACRALCKPLLEARPRRTASGMSTAKPPSRRVASAIDRHFADSGRLEST